MYGLWGRRFDPDGFREPGRCGGCREGECRKRCHDAVLVLLGLSLLSGCSRPPAAEFRTFTYDTMATKLVVTVPDRPSAEADAEAVAEVFRGVDARMSEWKDSSPLSAVNREAGGAPVPVPQDLRQVLHRAVEIGRATDGAFDVTWAALWGLWDFRAPDPRVPDAGEIVRRAALVDYRELQIDDALGTVRLPRPGQKLGLGGIAKGYALDAAARALRDRGVVDFLIVGGGQIMAGGRKGDRPWRTGLRDPRGGPEDYFAGLELRDESISTSGDYESFFEADGRRYHHILDPRTGWPAEGVRSATVLSPDATLADALSTACMIMSPEQSLQVCQDLHAEAVLIDATGALHMTPAMPDRLELYRQPLREPQTWR